MSFINPLPCNEKLLCTLQQTREEPEVNHQKQAAVSDEDIFSRMQEAIWELDSSYYAVINSDKDSSS